MDGYLTTSLQELKDTEVQFAQEIKWLLFRVKPELSQSLGTHGWTRFVIISSVLLLFSFLFFVNNKLFSPCLIIKAH
jgi:hypothetical protein